MTLLHRLLPLLAILLGTSFARAADRPNFLWLTSEDNSPYLGCYGDKLAQTPNLDKLAAEGIRFRNFFANAPVCSASRSTLIAGMYGPTLGIQHHRSTVAIPAGFKLYPEHLRAAGYYCTNNFKTDYNVAGAAPGRIWDQSSKDAHYKNRKPGQPFFAVFNFTTTHESQVTPKQGKGAARVAPGQIVLPPYHPDEPDIRRDWANYYDQMTQMDGQIGKMLDELDALGLAQDTIVFYYGDHGGALPRGKRNVHDSGTRVPLIVRIPARWAKSSPVAAGGWVESPASFVDLPPTVFALAGIPQPANYQGVAFLGENRPAPRGHVLLHRGRMDERYDNVRSVRTATFQYLRNYSPHRSWGQHYSYPFEVQASMRAWYAAYQAGRCNEVQSRYWKPKPAEELYDIAADPFEVRNLATAPEQADRFRELRATLRTDLIATRDTGFIPEGMFSHLAAGKTIYDYAQGDAYPIERIVDVADLATAGDAANLPRLQKLLADEHPVIRYWAATGCLILRDKSAAAKDALLAVLADPMPDVRVVAAEALGYLGETEKSLDVLSKVLNDGEKYEKLAALNTLDFMIEAQTVPLDKGQTLVRDVTFGEPLDRIKRFILAGRQ